MRYRNYNNGGNFFWLGIMIFFLFGGFKTLFLILPLLSLAPLFIFGFIVYKLTKTIKVNQTMHQYTKGATKERLHYVELIIRLMAHAMRVDGRVDQEEVNAVFHFFQQRLRFNTQTMYWVRDMMQHALQHPYSIDTLLKAMNAEFSTDEKQLCVELLMIVIVADKKIDANESKLLDTVVHSLSIDSTFFNQLKKQYMASTHSDFEILGVSSTATKEEIKHAYKQLCKRYHPDKVQHLGDEFKDFAEEKIKAINKAYDAIMSKKVNA